MANGAGRGWPPLYRRRVDDLGEHRSAQRPFAAACAAWREAVPVAELKLPYYRHACRRIDTTVG
jgi:hypothetical protein